MLGKIDTLNDFLSPIKGSVVTYFMPNSGGWVQEIRNRFVFM